MQYSQELIICGGIVKIRRFLVNKEGVWDPDQLNILSADDQLLQARLAFEGEPRIPPKLTEVHVESEILKEEEERRRSEVGCQASQVIRHRDEVS